MIPSFNIYDVSTGKKVETLTACHIERLVFERKNLPAVLCASDGQIYQVVYDCRIPEGLEYFTGIVSFQQHTYGRFAIVRIAKEGDKK